MEKKEEEKEEGEISVEEAVGAVALGAAAVAGGYLLYKFISNLFDKNTEVWTCGNCGFILGKHYERCPNCGEKIEWG
jgi:rubrerythrin